MTPLRLPEQRRGEVRRDLTREESECAIVERAIRLTLNFSALRKDKREFFSSEEYRSKWDGLRVLSQLKVSITANLWIYLIMRNSNVIGNFFLRFTFLSLHKQNSLRSLSLIYIIFSVNDEERMRSAFSDR